jgi:hypothetical protein
MTTEQKNKPQLSILIPSIPSRSEKAVALYNRIMGMVGDKNIEVLMLIDNKMRTIGEKREALKNISNGKYFMIVDDDDDLLTLEEVYDATTENVDVITFKSRCFNSDRSQYVVTFGLGNKVEHNTKADGMYSDMSRPPFHMCAWHEKFKIFSFPAKSFGEDWGFIESALKAAVTEKHLPFIVHQYNFNPSMSEALTSNQVEGVVNTDSNVASEVIKTDEVNMANLVSGNEKRYAIVNLITDGVPRYKIGQDRLIDSMKKYCPDNVDCFYFNGEETVGAPKHSDNPYAFKLYAIKKVRDMGYRQVLWLDASIVAAGDFMSVFAWMEEKGVFLEHSGWKAGQWTNDVALTKLKTTREEAWQMPMFSAGFCGFNFDNTASVLLFEQWWKAMLDGCFRGSWDNHRHDMSAGSIIANKMNLLDRYAECTQFFSYIGPGYTPNPSSPFQLIGL